MSGVVEIGTKCIYLLLWYPQWPHEKYITLEMNSLPMKLFWHLFFIVANICKLHCILSSKEQRTAGWSCVIFYTEIKGKRIVLKAD